MSDEDIVRTEKHFQENKVVPSDFAAQATLNASPNSTLIAYLLKIYSPQVHWHVVSEDSTLAGGNIPYVPRILG